jgi:hypothetical protein
MQDSYEDTRMHTQSGGQCASTSNSERQLRYVQHRLHHLQLAEQGVLLDQVRHRWNASCRRFMHERDIAESILHMCCVN